MMLRAIGNITKNYLVAIYIRLSKEDIKENGKADESESIQNQKILLTKYVKDQGYTLVDTYIDDGYTGTNFKRPAFQRMLKDIEDGKINMVITKDLSRLSRDYIGTGEFVEKWFPAHGIRYVALTDAIDTEVDNANNDIAPFKAILNDMYAKDLSKKIRTALHTMQSEGKWVGGCAPFGYKVDSQDKNHLVIDDVEGPIIKRIFNLFLKGYRINQIRNILNDEHVSTFSLTRNRSLERSGGGNIYGYWCNTTLKKILKNRIYTGDMVQNKRNRISYKYRKIVANSMDKWIIVENTHEPLISKSDFAKIQEMLPKQAQRNDKKEYFLLDGLLKCAECGHSISIRPRRLNGKASTICNYYRKYKKEYHLCTAHGFDYDTIELGVINALRNIIALINVSNLDKKLQNKYEEINSTDNKKKYIAKLEYEIEQLKNTLDNMYIDKLQNKITNDLFERVQEKLLKDIKGKEDIIKIKTNDIKKLANNKDKENTLNNIINEFLRFKNPSRDVILKLIKHISIADDGNINIYLNFKELIL